jgi:restriction endonuclease S subunit
MLKTDWPVKTLSEVAVLNPSEPALSEDAPFVPMDAVTAGKRHVQYTQPRGQRSGARARAGDILFARITPCLQNGKVALVQDEIERCGGSTEFIVVRAGTDVLNGFLYQWITAKHIRDHVTALMKGATGRQRLNAEDLALTELRVPPLEEQKRIVALLDAATARVTELTACYEQARNHANKLFTSALRDALESNPNWPVKTLGDISEIAYGYTESAKSEEVGPKFLRITDIKDRGVNWHEVPFCPIDTEQLKRHRLEDGDIVFARTGATTGKSFLVSEPPLAVCASYLIRLRIDKKMVSPDFLNLNFQTTGYWKQVNDGMSGAAQGGFNATKLGALEIPVPPLEEQKSIVLRLDSMRAKTSEMVVAYDAKLQAAKDLRQSILESAFAGEL